MGAMATNRDHLLTKSALPSTSWLGRAVSSQRNPAALMRTRTQVQQGESKLSRP